MRTHANADTARDGEPCVLGAKGVADDCASDTQASESDHSAGSAHSLPKEKRTKSLKPTSVNDYEKEMADGVARKVAKKRLAAAKRPASASGAMKRPAAAVWAKGSKPPMSKAGDGPLDYNTGRIYVSVPRKSYRAITTRGDFNTEKSALWAASAPTLNSWSNALKLIDGAMRSK